MVTKLMPFEAASARADLTIGSRLPELARARKFVEQFCRQSPDHVLAEDDIAVLVLAVDEAISNVVKHAYHGRADQRIEIKAESFPERIAIRLRYQGATFEPHGVAAPTFDGSRDSGFGVFMITRSVDAVRYYRDELRRCCIRLEKHRKAA